MKGNSLVMISLQEILIMMTSVSQLLRVSWRNLAWAKSVTQWDHGSYGRSGGMARRKYGVLFVE
jgi:hypothetical protein